MSRIISLDTVKESIKKLASEASIYLNEDMVNGFNEAGKSETNKVALNVLNTLLENQELARNEKIPMCQDTGLAIVLLQIGEEIHFDKPGLVEAINQGITEAYQEGYLRKSVVGDPLRRKNTGTNTPAMITYEIVPGDKMKLLFLAKGTGAENKSRLKMLVPADGREGIENFALDVVKNAGGEACPPLVVGVGIGGNFDKCALLAKKALFRPLGKPNPDPFYAEFEKELLNKINATGIGPQGFGGATTALAVHIEYYPCHIGALPVAVNLDCHAHRCKEIIL
jgi:fumarate hydratase subunit alpha